MQCFICEDELRPGALFCDNCGQDQRVVPLPPLYYSDKLRNKISQASLPITTEKYIIAKNYLKNVSTIARFLVVVHIEGDKPLYAWDQSMSAATRFTEEEKDTIITKLRKGGITHPFNIIKVSE